VKFICAAIFIFLLAFNQAYCYKNAKAILVCNRQIQKDSIGYNIVGDLAAWAYNQLDSGKIEFWDSPEKKFRLKIDDLKGIEKTSGISFANLSNIFIYETWTLRKHKFKFELKGFSFTTVSKKGDEVLYGYVECNSKIKRQLAETRLNVNADGMYGMTLWQALMNMQYDFDVVFFNDEPIKTLQQDQKIKLHALEPRNKKINELKVPEAKLVEYAVETGPSMLSEKSISLMKQMEDFFNDNKQEFFNYGGDNILSYLKNSPVIISQFNVAELWSKSSGTVAYSPQQIIPYVVGIPLQPIALQQWQDWKVKFDSVSVNEALVKKNFYYIIQKINNTNINHTQSAIFSEAPEKANWDGILEYARKN